MNDSLRMRRERRLLVLLGLACLALIGGALYLQYFKHEAPCPLCIIQRYFFLLIAVFAFIGATLRGWRGIAVLETLIVVAAAGGMAAAIQHIEVQANPSFSCGSDTLEPIVDALPLAKLWPGAFKVAGLCEIPYPPILGLSLPQWGLVAFGLTFVLVSRSLWRTRKLRALRQA
ncbi:disulfide bond formation protein B [Mycetohabitans endofungorum]|uniref:disulfide bond formation protein B n=1 Tax=Mycetohabitans endofungorum TaxID=417203 RepID=UPI0030CB51E8